MITKINHIGIAVNAIEEAVKLYTEVLGLKLKNIEIVEDQKARTAIIPVGGSKLELIESTRNAQILLTIVDKAYRNPFSNP